jgi:enoyl-CoA hydratase
VIEIAREGGLLLITLNRPDKANALTAEMLAGVVAALEGPPPAALILTGAGRVFSAGADLDEMQAGLGLIPLWEAASGAIAGLPCLTIAALNGTLAGVRWGWRWPAICASRCPRPSCSIR